MGHEIGLFLRDDETHKVKFLVEMFGSKKILVSMPLNLFIGIFDLTLSSHMAKLGHTYILQDVWKLKLKIANRLFQKSQPPNCAL